MKTISINSKKAISYTIDLLRKTGLSDQTLAMNIRMVHIFIPYLIMYYIFYASKFISTIILIFSIISLIMFYIFDGCLLSKLEYKLDGLNYTIIDMYLELLSIEKTNQNRKKYTFIAGSFFSFIF
jgi:hypothetical protein